MNPSEAENVIHHAIVPKYKGPLVRWQLTEDQLLIRTTSSAGPAQGDRKTIPLDSIQRITLRNAPSLWNKRLCVAELTLDDGSQLKIPSSGWTTRDEPSHARDSYIALIQGLATRVAQANPALIVRSASHPGSYWFLLIVTLGFILLVAHLFHSNQGELTLMGEGVVLLLIPMTVIISTAIMLGVRIPSTLDPAMTIPEHCQPPKDSPSDSKSTPV